VAGGGQLYAAALPLAPVAEVTEVDTDVTGDTYAPPLDDWTLVSDGGWRTSTAGLRYRFLRFTRPG
jgi:dihydrofolate reductase